MVSKRIKQGVCGALLTVTLLGVSAPVIQWAVTPEVAHAIRPTADGRYPKWNPKDPAGWSQNPDGDGSHLPPDNKKGIPGYMYGTQVSFGLSTKKADNWCMIYSTTFLFLKAGVVPVGTSPTDVHDRIYDSMKSYGWTNYDLLTDADMGGKMEMVEKGTFYNNKTSSAKLKEMWNKGYLLILNVPISGGLHAIVVDKIEGDNIYILDSGNWGLKLSDHYGNESVVGYQAFRMKDGTKAKDLPVLQDHPDGDFGSPNTNANSDDYTLTEEMIAFEGGGGVWSPDELDIPNMPSYREWLEYNNSGLSGGDESYMDFIEKLNSEEVKEDFAVGTDGGMSIAKWKEEQRVNYAKEGVQAVRTANMFVGIALAVLTAPFVLVYWFDRYNIFGFSLLDILSGGRLRVVNGQEYEDLKRNYNGKLPFRPISDKTIFVYVAVISAIVAFILSGQAYNLFSFVTEYVQHILGYFS